MWDIELDVIYAQGSKPYYVVGTASQVVGPNDHIQWTQLDGTIKATNWIVTYKTSPNVCNSGIQVTIPVTHIGDPGPQDETVKLGDLNLPQGQIYMVVQAQGVAGISGCSNEISFKYNKNK